MEEKLIDSLKKALIDFWEREETSVSVAKRSYNDVAMRRYL